MYSDLIDSVKSNISDKASLMRAETFLFQSLLNGNRPTLTLTQAIDSTAILSIAQNPKQSDYFIKAIKDGHIRISLYGQANSLQGYLLQTLKRNADINSSKFTFSSMPFLYNFKYSDSQRIEIFSALINQIQEGNPRLKSGLIDNEDKDYLEEYVETIRKINYAARDSYIPASKASKQLKDIIRFRINERIKTIVNNDSLKMLLTVIESNCVSNYRTFYYDIINEKSQCYDSLTIQEARELIDYCYNEVVASSVNDNEPAKLHIPNMFPELAASATEFSSTETASNDEIIVSDSTREYITWERLLIIMKEIREIQDMKKCTWNEAIDKYASHQRLLPFKLSAKYMGISALTVGISSIPFLGKLVTDFTTELLWNSTCDIFGETTRKPSFSEIIKVSKESQKKCKVLNMAISQTSLNIKANSLK